MMNELSTSPHDKCGHWIVRHGTCLVCKTKPTCLEDHEAFDYLFPGLCLSPEAVSFTKRLTTLTSLYVYKKLHLVLDLDHTLLHSVMVSDLSDSEKYLIELEKSGSENNLKRFGDRLVKLRPLVNEFLSEANKLFNMYVYTRASRGYAQYIMTMIDPHGTYFGDRVITIEESPDYKTLDLVLADERAIFIVDDSVDVWPDDKRNLLTITRYSYFKDDPLNTHSNWPSYAEKKEDESESGGSLAKLLKYLKESHNGFFSCKLEHELDSKDVNSPSAPLKKPTTVRGPLGRRGRGQPKDKGKAAFAPNTSNQFEVLTSMTED